MMDSNGDVVAVHDRPELTVEAFRKTGKLARRFLAAREKAEAGDEEARAELLLLRMQMGMVSYADAEEQAGGLQFTPEQNDRFQDLLLDLEVNMMFDELRRDPGSGEKLSNLGKRWLARAREGRQPVRDRPFLVFWSAIFHHAESEGDLASYRLGVDAFRGRFEDSDNAQYKSILSSLEQRLEQLEQEEQEEQEEEEQEEENP